MLKRYMATYQSDFLETYCADISEDEDGDLVLYGDAAALEAENAALREKLATAEAAPKLVRYDIEKDREFKDGFDRLAASGIDKKTRRVIVKEVMSAIHAHAEAFYQRGLAAAEARTVLTDPQIKAIAINYAVHVGGDSYSDSYDVTRYECAEDFFNCVRAILAASAAPAAQEDAKRLDFMIQQEAWISWSKDGESCRVFHSDADGEARPFMGWGFTKAWHHDARPAIDAAIAANTPKET